MGITTTADEKLSTAKAGISEAVEALSDIVVKQCWGYDEWSNEYRTKIIKAFHQLLALRNNLK